MAVPLAVIGRQFSEPVTGSDGRPIDLSDCILPRSHEAPSAERLLDAVEEAVREMRIRQRNAPMSTDAPLWPGLILTRSVETVDLDLQSIDFRSSDDQSDVIDALRTLERTFLSS